MRCGSGALVEFTGIVRGTEDGCEISALRYEAYQPMAENQMRRILNHLHETHPCLRVKIVHRIGVVPVGEVAIYIGVESAHRAEAFAMAAGFMDRLKQDVPIWKTEVIP
ncbi:MAG: molybdenum cofactor biosynthesis protein MoaE [Verrucomicrobiota bacterium]